jgi:hypothetical protein
MQAYVCTVVVVILGGELKSFCVSFHLPVIVCHSYSFDIAQLFCQMHFKIFRPSIVQISALMRKPDC